MHVTAAQQNPGAAEQEDRDCPGSGFRVSSKRVGLFNKCVCCRTAAQEDPEAAEQAFAAASPTYADLKQKYDRSRKTVTRTGAPALEGF